MAYKLLRLTSIRATPSKTADPFDVLGTGVVMFGTGKTATDADGKPWISILIPPGVLDGWIPLGNASEVADPAPAPMDPESFVRQCTLVDRSMNSDPAITPWFVTADFIIARALFETGMAVTHFDAPRVTGPFGLLQTEWEAFRTSALAGAADYQPGDAIFPMVQVYAAAYRMHTDGEAFSKLMAPPMQDGTNQVFVPSYLDLFHCYLTDAKTAKDIRDSESKQDALVSAVVGDHLAAIKSRPQFNTLKDTMTVAQFIAATQSVLADLLNTAFDKIRTFAADELPRQTPGSAPWLDVARAEMQAGVTEASQPDRIKSYFAATDFGPVGDPTPAWCGAFAAFCVKQAGLTPPKGAGAADSWKSWGTISIPLGSHDIPAGAVVVLTASAGTDAVGHVGFFTRFSDAGDQVMVLAGNQTNGVNEAPYAVPRIAAIRTVETLIPIDAANRYDMTAAGVKKDFQKYGDLIVDRFQRAGFTKDQQLVAALANAIGESGLDPSIKAGGSEESYGLFQCNRKAGLGIGYTIEQLKDPETNIAIIIREARKFSAFTAASSIESAVGAFVRFIERPKDTSGAIKRRMMIAKQLL
ncbi:CHAP domain-containing protein [Mesorhizobium sp. C386A]|uniref:CHAP domain-containing protein n=1 Tax=unclassified Mesorhizobium TaxID=325217 RepID=UPI0003CF1AF5|nr:MULTISPECIES: CHAP domain-containing protein [unclassified Mesorhizobium]ESY08876.1 hypothetical protein X752_21205 [Mesorhizobium sp. LNJC398B00]ESY31829.1 hypothetical protein X748_24225 [Mesorhizobium sp. LNJC386A00]